MNQQYLRVSLACVGLFLAAVSATWAGAGQTCPGQREAVLAHVCDGGARDGLSCQVDMGQVCAPTSDDCPEGTCMLDYTTRKVFRMEVTLMFDKEASTYAAPETSLGATLTVLLCVRKNGKHCFTQTYRLGTSCGGDLNLVQMGVFGCVLESQIAGLSDDKELLKENWLYVLLEASNPNGSLVQELRDLLEVAGVPVVTDIAKSYGGEDHTGDSTGSVGRFIAKLRFISGVN